MATAKDFTHYYPKDFTVSASRGSSIDAYDVIQKQCLTYLVVIKL